MIGCVIKSTNKKTNDVHFYVCMRNDNMYMSYSSIDDKEAETWQHFFKEERKTHNLTNKGCVEGESYENIKMQLTSLLCNDIDKNKQYAVTIYCYMCIVSTKSFEPINKIKEIKSFDIINGKFIEIPNRINVIVSRYKNYEI